VTLQGGGGNALSAIRRYRAWRFEEKGREGEENCISLNPQKTKGVKCACQAPWAFNQKTWGKGKRRKEEIVKEEEKGRKESAQLHSCNYFSVKKGGKVSREKDATFKERNFADKRGEGRKLLPLIEKKREKKA